MDWWCYSTAINTAVALGQFALRGLHMIVVLLYVICGDSGCSYKMTGSGCSIEMLVV